MGDEDGDGVTGNPGATIAPPNASPFGAGFKLGGAGAAGKAAAAKAAAAMEAEIERADCREMVRDITHAVLPTRATMQHPGLSLERPNSINEDEEEDPAAEEVYTFPSQTNMRKANSNSQKQSGAGVFSSPPRKAAETGPMGGGSRKPRQAGGRVAEEEEWSNDGWGGHDEDTEATALAMQAAIASNRADMVETLLVGDSEGNGRIDANLIVKNGKRPLGLAAAAGLYDIACTLLQNGADPACNDENGDTPLHLAASRGHIALARLLLEQGALPSVLDSRGCTPLQLAKSPQMQQLLRAADAGDDLPPRLEGEEEDDDEEEEGPSPSNDETAAKPNRKASASSTNSGNSGNSGAAVPFGPPPLPSGPLGDSSVQYKNMKTSTLITELQQLLNSREVDMKRLLVVPCGLLHEVQMDVMRVGKGNTYKCYLRLGGQNDRRVCIFEASRTRKGKLKNSQYSIMMPQADPRFTPAEYGPINEMSDAAREQALYCGKVRSYNLSGANFIAYDDGVKPENLKPGDSSRFRRQMVAMCFNKSTSRRVPMTMRMLLPTPTPGSDDAPIGAASELLDSLQAVPLESGQEVPPSGTQLLKLVPPRWNADEQMFQLFCEGRACCMSNKNVQLADTARPEEAALQIGKLRNNMFNVDLGGCVSPFQGFAAALAVFDQSSVRRRF